MAGTQVTIRMLQICQMESEQQEMLCNPERMREHLESRRQMPLAILMRALELQRAEDVRQIMAQ